MKPLRWVFDQVNASFEGKEAPLLMKAGHYSRWVITAWAAYSIVNALMGEPANAWYWRTVNGLGGTAFALSMIGMIIHSRRMCEPCIAEAPLNPQAQAARWKLALQTAHARRLTLAYCAAVFLWAFAAPVVLPSGWGRYATDISVQVIIVAFNWAQWQHSRLQPWCPFCDWGRGGSKEPSPDVPAPVVSA